MAHFLFPLADAEDPRLFRPRVPAKSMIRQSLEDQVKRVEYWPEVIQNALPARTAAKSRSLHCR